MTGKGVMQLLLPATMTHARLAYLSFSCSSTSKTSWVCWW